MNRIILALALALPAGGLVHLPAHAQGKPPGTFSTTLSVTGAQQFGAGLGQGGGATFAGGVGYQFVPAFAGGLALRYEVQDWPFEAPPEFGGTGPWGRLHRPAVSLPLSLALSRTLLVGLAPGMEWAGESRTATVDGLTWGAVASVAKVFSPRLVLGGGANVSRQFYSVKLSPFLIVNWRLNDRLRIANAPGAGPLGGAGVELRYEPGPDWELAAGGVYRGDRYRLDHHHSYVGDVAEVSGIPLLARATRTLDARSRADLSAGVLLAGRLRVKDDAGRTLADGSYAPAPMIALTLSRRF